MLLISDKLLGFIQGVMQETEESQTGLIEFSSHHAGTSFLDQLAQAVRIIILEIINCVIFRLIKQQKKKTFLSDKQ